MQQLFNTKNFRYNILIDDEEYYLVDSFFNLIAFFTPGVLAFCKRNAFCIDKSLINDEFLLMNPKKDNLNKGTIALAMGISSVGWRVLSKISDYYYLDISRKTATIITLMIITATVLYCLFMIRKAKETLNSLILLENLHKIKIKKYINHKEKKLKALLYILTPFYYIVMYFGFFAICTLNISAPNLIIFFVIIIWCCAHTFYVINGGKERSEDMSFKIYL